jgi:hypothetical protein
MTDGLVCGILLVMKCAVLVATGLIVLPLVGGCAPPVESADPAEQEQRLTPALARAALGDLIRSRPDWPLADLDADEWASKPLHDNADGSYDLGGVIHLIPAECRYRFTVMPQPGARACVLEYEGRFRNKSGKWLASPPELVSAGLQKGD